VSALPLPSPNTSSIEVISDMSPPSTLRPLTQNSHSMITRGKTSISKTKHSNYVCQVPSSPLLCSLIVMKEPKGVKSATKIPEWRTAMNEEIHALKLNQTWDLVQRPSAKNVVGAK